jgi:hypothetical protein
MVSILLSVSAVLLLAVVLTCSLLMIPTQSRRLRQAGQTFSYLLGNGSSQALCSVLCREAQSLL